MKTQTSRVSASRHALPSTWAMLVTLLLTTLLLNGCTLSSGVQSHGAKTYRVEGASEFGLRQAKERAYEEASTYCSSSDERVNEISSSTGSYRDIFGDPLQTFEIVFECTTVQKNANADTAGDFR